MTQRRRFFPAAPVQTAPGRSVELGVQLQPGAAPATGACECNVEGLAMLPGLIPYPWIEPGAVVPHMDAGLSFGPLYRPRMEGWRCTGAYILIPSPSTTSPPRLRFIVAGKTTCDVQWSWSLDTPELPMGPYSPADIFWDGLEIEEQGGTLSVTVLKGFMYDSESRPWWANLTVSATCAGKPIGSAVLRPGINFHTPEDLPLPE